MEPHRASPRIRLAGVVCADKNNCLTMNTSQGSGARTDIGLNMSSQLTDKFRVGAQLYGRNLGQMGYFGIRAGKVKTTLGLHNDSQDLDFLHVFALLPQGVYSGIPRSPISGRRHLGNVPLHHHLGDMSYTVYGGHRSDNTHSGYLYMISI